jgi:hypothetical protein
MYAMVEQIKAITRASAAASAPALEGAPAGR